MQWTCNGGGGCCRAALPRSSLSSFHWLRFWLLRRPTWWFGLLGHLGTIPNLFCFYFLHFPITRANRVIVYRWGRANPKNDTSYDVWRFLLRVNKAVQDECRCFNNKLTRYMPAAEDPVTMSSFRNHPPKVAGGWWDRVVVRHLLLNKLNPQTVL